jgi:hypothetical protein
MIFPAQIVKCQTSEPHIKPSTIHTSLQDAFNLVYQGKAKSFEKFGLFSA